MHIFHKLFNTTQGMKCLLLTWEFCTTFDGEPSARDVQEKFAGEMPQLLARMNDTCGVKFWPMVSFNATEGRLWRYMVVVPQERCLSKKRHLPNQICLMTLASNFMTSQQEGNSGNCVFWTLFENTLYILVYMEGRLCHWSEESGYVFSETFSRETLIRNRLDRFRNFLQQDSLFSRGEHFEIVELNLDADGFSRDLFLAASRDPFLRKRDCNEILQESRSLRKYSFGLFLFVLFAALVAYHPGNNEKGNAFSEIPDVEEIELDLPPLVEIVDEPRLVSSFLPDVPVVRKKSPVCSVPTLRLKGIVGDKLAIVEFENRSVALTMGDSIGEYVVCNVGRDRISLTCNGDSLEVTFL